MSKHKSKQQAASQTVPDNRIPSLEAEVQKLRDQLAAKQAAERVPQVHAPEPTPASETQAGPDFVAETIKANEQQGKVMVGAIFGYDPDLSPLERELAKLDEIRRRDRLEREELSRHGSDHGTFDWRMRMIQCGRR